MVIKKIFYSSYFLRKIRKIPREEKDLLNKFEKTFRNNCLDPNLKTHKLSGKLSGFWAASISHKTRILFRFYNKKAVIFIDVGNHAIYKK